MWIAIKVSLKRVWKWEFWPYHIFYIPLYFYWLYLSTKARSLSFFTAANPSIETGGFVDFQKSTVYSLIPSCYLPQTSIIEEESLSVANVLALLKFNALDFPLMIKPDNGDRGFGVIKLKSESDIEQYIENYRHIDKRFILQEYIDMPIELGIMYHRMPHHQQGKITSVVHKELPKLCGDGMSTLEGLILNDQRLAYHYHLLKRRCKERFKEIIPKNEIVDVVELGNHCKGATFLNASILINAKLTEVIDKIAWQIDGYHFGRFDLKVPSLNDLYAGKNIKIIALNGANSEPAHIYDPAMSLWQAYKDLLKHWKILYKVCVANHKRGVAYMPFHELVQKLLARKKLRKVSRQSSGIQHQDTGYIHKS